MSDQAASTQVIAPVRYAVTVPLPADRAFTLFTEGFNSWWPGHHIGTAEIGTAHRDGSFRWAPGAGDSSCRARRAAGVAGSSRP